MDWTSIRWTQFGASIDMLENAIVACPDEIWEDRQSTDSAPHCVGRTRMKLEGERV